MSKFLKVEIIALSALVCVFGASCEDSHDSPSEDVAQHQQQQYETSSGSTARLKLQYVYGGFRGGNAVEDPDVRISGLKINGRSGMSYSWAGGSSLRFWGLSDGQADALACIFYQDANGNWIGGKFDWVSTNRRTRDFKNLNGGYGGWKPELFYAAKKHGFCIVSEDGRKRSNFITD